MYHRTGMGLTAIYPMFESYPSRFQSACFCCLVVLWFHGPANSIKVIKVGASTSSYCSMADFERLSHPSASSLFFFVFFINGRGIMDIERIS